MASAFLVRFMVALWGHSGEGKAPMFGDFEAHRHWMEITSNLPIGDWYRSTPANDLNYWGLDYPPLMAYMSWLFGRISKFFVPGMVDLFNSRGLETIDTKVFMRMTVLLGDCLLLIPVFLLLSRHRYSNLKTSWKTPLVPLASLLAPALILIDHGHFQYNGMCIGLALIGASLVARNYDLLGSVCFCLSLNMKQMSLYYAPVFFCALLRKCLLQKTWPERLLKLLAIGLTVVATFGVLWLPFCVFAAEGQSCVDGLLSVLSRQFPFQRGIFEDKVANLWYALSVVVDFRFFLSLPQMLSLSLALTLLLLAPTCFLLLTRPLSWPHILLALVNSAFAYFLASFQVHEKSVLLVLVPASMLALLDPAFCHWVEAVGCFTLYPLLRRDGLAVPYFALVPLYSLLMEELGRQMYALDKKTDSLGIPRTVGLMPFRSPWQQHASVLAALKVLRVLSYVGMVLLHLGEAFVPPPAHLPDLYPALFALFGACNFLVAYAQTVVWQFSVSAVPPTPSAAISLAQKEEIGKSS